MNSDLDFLEKSMADDIGLDEELSNLFNGYSDLTTLLQSGNLTSGQLMEPQSTINAGILSNKQQVISDHNYLGSKHFGENVFCADFGENLSDSGSGSSSTSPYSKSPEYSDSTTSPQIELLNEAVSPSFSGYDDHSQNMPFIKDLQFDFSDIDMERMIDNFPLASDDTTLLDSCSQIGNKRIHSSEDVCIELDDALSLKIRRKGNELPSVKNNMSETTLSTSSIGMSANPDTVLNVSKVNPTVTYRCTLPNFKPLVLTGEEKRLLQDENVTLPTDLPLTKSEERVLKRVRRKIRNKKSAMESRKRRKEYLGGLENRVVRCTIQNNELTKKIEDLENQNKSLYTQLKKLQDIVRCTSNKTTQATTCVMVLLLSFGLFLAPNYGPLRLTGNESPSEHEMQTISVETHKSRRVLEVSADALQPEAKRLRIDVLATKQESLDVIPFYGQSDDDVRKAVHETAIAYPVEMPVKEENNSSNNASKVGEEGLHSLQLLRSGSTDRDGSSGTIYRFGPESILHRKHEDGLDSAANVQSGLRGPMLNLETPKSMRISRMDEI